MRYIRKVGHLTVSLINNNQNRESIVNGTQIYKMRYGKRDESSKFVFGT